MSDENNTEILIEPARREQVPILVGLAGPSGAGKTYSALLLAAGMAGDGGKIGIIDTDNRRASMYATDPGICAAIPQGYQRANMSDPYTPQRFIQYARAFEKQGFDVLVVDTITHEYEGTGGLEDMAATQKTKWLQPKLQHKKMMNALLALNMDIIFSIRARERVKVDKKTGEYIDLGIQPVCEKNFMYDMTVSMLLDAETNIPLIIKKPPLELRHAFNNQMGLITKNHGAKLREWTMGAIAIDPVLEKYKSDCREAARGGSSALDNFVKTIPVTYKSMLAPYGAEFRSIATQSESAIAILAAEQVQEPPINFQQSKLA